MTTTAALFYTPRYKRHMEATRLKPILTTMSPRSRSGSAQSRESNRSLSSRHRHLFKEQSRPTFDMDLENRSLYKRITEYKNKQTLLKNFRVISSPKESLSGPYRAR